MKAKDYLALGMTPPPPRPAPSGRNLIHDPLPPLERLARELHIMRRWWAVQYPDLPRKVQAEWDLLIQVAEGKVTADMSHTEQLAKAIRERDELSEKSEGFRRRLVETAIELAETRAAWRTRCWWAAGCVVAAIVGLMWGFYG